MDGKNNDVLKLISNIEEVSKQVNTRKKELESQLSIEDKTKCDIEHYIEFNNLSASQGYKAQKMLKDCLLRRRKIKNEIDEINAILLMTVNDIEKGKIKLTLKSLSKRSYKPRVLKDLFN